MVRHIRLTSADDLDRPAVKALMAEALKRADPPLEPEGETPGGDQATAEARPADLIYSASLFKRGPESPQRG